MPVSKHSFRHSPLFAWALAAALVTGCASHVDAPTAQSSDRPVAARGPAGSMAAAMAAQDEADLIALPGVVGDGIELSASGTPRIVAYVRDASVCVPGNVGGVPVRLQISGRFHGFALTDRFRPVPIGVSLGNNQECLPGTVGAIVTRNGRRFVLCANHVLARENLGRLGEAIVQPSRPDGSSDCSALPEQDVVALLAEFEPLHFDGTPNAMDAAIAEFTRARPTAATPPGYYGVPDTATEEPERGMAILKLGRTTGLTRGRITAVRVRVVLSLPQGDALDVGQCMTTPNFGDFGDSGSLVVTDDREHHPVAMVIGGDETGAAVVTPIGRILRRFGVAIARP